jgi:hypothetical protein
MYALTNIVLLIVATVMGGTTGIIALVLTQFFHVHYVPDDIC